MGYYHCIVKYGNTMTFCRICYQTQFIKNICRIVIIVKYGNTITALSMLMKPHWLSFEFWKPDCLNLSNQHLGDIKTSSWIGVLRYPIDPKWGFGFEVYIIHGESWLRSTIAAVFYNNDVITVTCKISSLTSQIDMYIIIHLSDAS